MYVERTRKLPRQAISADDEMLLVVRARNGDKVAMERLLARHYRQMYHLALKVTRDAVRAQDVTQESCLQVIRRLHQFRGEARFGSWLSRIVVNTALLRHRREKRLVPTAEIFSPLDQAKEPLPDLLASDREVLHLTDELLGSLRDGDRDLFVRRFVEGHSLKQISADTGLSLPALKSRFHRARQRLKATSESERWGLRLSTAA